MAAAPGLLHEPLEAALRAAGRPQRSARRTGMGSWQARALLLVFVVVLGLLQGTRTALVRTPLPSAAALPDAASPPTRELDWRRGHFFRPAGSTAERPPLALRPHVWRPAPPTDSTRIARACAARAGGSC